MLFSLSPTRVGAKSQKNVRSSRLSAVASARSARSAQSGTFRSILGQKSMKHKSLPSFLRDEAPRKSHSSRKSRIGPFQPANPLVPIQELLSEAEAQPMTERIAELLRRSFPIDRDASAELKAALEHGLYGDADVLLRTQGAEITASHLKMLLGEVLALLGHAEFPVSVVEAFFAGLRKNGGKVYLFSVAETQDILKRADVSLNYQSVNDYDTLLFPLLTDHWSLFIVSIPSRTAELFEVLRWRKINASHQSALSSFLQGVLRERGLPGSDFSWSLSTAAGSTASEESGKCVCEHASKLCAAAGVAGREAIFECLVQNCEPVDCS